LPKGSPTGAQEIEDLNVVPETDSTGVAAKLKKGDMDQFVHSPLVEEIKKTLLAMHIV
jgi:hypothetical protein